VGGVPAPAPDRFQLNRDPPLSLCAHLIIHRHDLLRHCDESVPARTVTTRSARPSRQRLEFRLPVADVLGGRLPGCRWTIAAAQHRVGRTVEIRDVQIAAIAASRRATVATRNTRHFDGTGVDLVNPWS